jgi:hypothetical protein
MSGGVRCLGSPDNAATPPSLPDTHPASNLADAHAHAHAHAVSGAAADGTVGRT